MKRRKHFLSQVRFDEVKVQKFRWRVFLVALALFFGLLICGMASSVSRAYASDKPNPNSWEPFPKQAQVLVPEPTSAAGSGAIAGGWPSEIQVLGGIITSETNRVGLDPDLMAAAVFVESWFNPANPLGYTRCPDGPSSASCTSSAGAIGPAQVMPFHFREGEDSRDLRVNIGRGAEILEGYIGQMSSIRGGLAAYYCGPNAAQWVSPDECWRYADKVLNVLVEKTS